MSVSPSSEQFLLLPTRKIATTQLQDDLSQFAGTVEQCTIKQRNALKEAKNQHGIKRLFRKERIQLN